VNLPDNINEFKPLKDVEEISKNARKTFLALILACVYFWLTIATISMRPKKFTKKAIN
jgi:hypothetical protein